MSRTLAPLTPEEYRALLRGPRGAARPQVTRDTPPASEAPEPPAKRATGAKSKRVPGVSDGSDATGTGSTDAERARMNAARPLVEASGIACPLAADDHAAVIREELAAGLSRAAARVGRRILLTAHVLDA